jgi:DNA-binding response OmpR family regulator
VISNTVKRCGAPAPAVLVVEDEIFVALEIEHTLTVAGYRVIGPVTTIGGALRALSLQRPDVAVLDFEVDGETVTPVAVALNQMMVPFIISSGASVDIIRRCNIFYGSKIIPKPVCAAKLIESIKEYL